MNRILFVLALAACSYVDRASPGVRDGTTNERRKDEACTCAGAASADFSFFGNEGSDKQRWPDATLKGHVTTATRNPRELHDPDGDYDGDGLSNREEDLYKTRKDIADSDGDALLDGWEVHGVDGMDLRALGASPVHKDIFVEMDYMRGFKPDSEVLERIAAAFTAAQVSYPVLGKLDGIKLHLHLDDELPLVSVLPHPWETCFRRLKNKWFTWNRIRVFHYMIWADRYTNADGETDRSGVSRGVPHSDFLVTLGPGGGSANRRVGTFMHELGHNLGLWHGGRQYETRTYKPNHLSVMNYRWQFDGVPHEDGPRFSFQPAAIVELDESRLREDLGLGKKPDLVNWLAHWNKGRQALVADAASAIDWNDDGRCQANVKADLNNDGSRGSTFRSTADEWESLVYYGWYIGTTLPPKGIVDFVNSGGQSGRPPRRAAPPPAELGTNTSPPSSLVGAKRVFCPR